ncbi:hypothetical protein [Maridesulfovibrio bastinii]|uniref:hypothetical protein n=1 Tax=Maridesulfovibrio bastinii TaxID=47157 RepID=UPI000417DFE9|nr:hypothetical protein [Maridesulfovibrio bastinii]
MLEELKNHPSYKSGKIDQEMLIKQLVELGWKQSASADFFGVSQAAVSKAKKRIDLAVSKDVALFSAPKMISAKLSLADQLEALGKQCRELLEMVHVVLHGDQSSQEYRDCQSKLRRLAGSKRDLGGFLIQLQAELRKQLEFVFKMQSEIYSLKKVEEFQSIVLEEIQNAAPEVQQRIVARLTEINAARSALDFGIGGGIGGAEKSNF